MRQRLPKEVYKSLLRTIDRGEPLDPKVADVVAATMKDWAIENGATHFTHWFQPLTGLTAEKHDSLVSPDGQGGVVFNFSGSDLVQGEPDAVELPVGRPPGDVRGPRLHRLGPDQPGVPDPGPGRHGARCASRPRSCRGPARRWTRRSRCSARWRRCPSRRCRILKVFGTDAGVSQVFTTVGPEQEYFLIDRDLFFAATGPGVVRADAVRGAAAQGPAARGPLLRHDPGAGAGVHARGGARAVAAGRAGEDAAQRGGAGPVRDRAAVRESQRRQRPPDADDGDDQAGGAAARPRGACCTRSRSPGINGSGKHNNWSMSTDTGVNLLDPQDDTHTNMQFLVFLVAVIRAVDLHADLLRASIASAANDHRLGANEAPPAIISIFLGDMLTDILDQLEQGLPKRTHAAAARSTSAPARCRSCRGTRATATAPARSRSPATSSSSARWARAPASPGPTRC